MFCYPFTAGDIKKKNVSSIDIKKQPTDSDSEKITTKTRSQRKRKISGGKLHSPVAKKRSGMILYLFKKIKICYFIQEYFIS